MAVHVYPDTALRPFLRSKIKLRLMASAVSAGVPTSPEEYLEARVDLNKRLCPNPVSSFILKVCGDSMQGAGIFDGDEVVVDRAIEPRDGSIVVALIWGEYTLKRVERVKGRLYLIPQNPNYQAIEITEDSQIEIWGVVRKVLRHIE